MDELTSLFREHHAKLFQQHGATPRGVDWNDEGEMLFRYRKIMEVLKGDFLQPAGDPPSLLDVGCGWGGLLRWSGENGIDLKYTGIDVVESMIDYCRQHYPQATFSADDVFELEGSNAYDFVVCNAILTQRLTASIADMERFAKRLIRKMFDLCRVGIAFNLMSNQVNFTVQNLYYKNPLETLAFCLSELAPRVKLDHGYSSLASGRGKYYDYTVYVYKD